MAATGRPSKIQMEEITNQVLDTARHAFCHMGMAGSSLDDIAHQAGITKRTIYRRYPSKQALLEAVVERDIEQFHAWLSGCMCEQMSSLEAFKETAWRFYTYNREPENNAFNDFVMGESIFSPEIRKKLAEWEQVGIAPIKAKVALAQKDGFIRDMNGDVITDIFLDLIFRGPLHRVRNIEAHPTNEAAVDFFELRWSVFLCACGNSDRI